jgi:hypothetical protein
MSGTIPLSKEKIEQHNLEMAARTRANATPLPGALARGFTPVPVKVGNFIVRAPVAYDYALLQEIKSPLYEELLEAAKPSPQQEPQKWTPQDNWNICWIFTRPAVEVDNIYSIDGIEGISKQARKEISMELQPVEIDQLIEAVVKQISLAFTTLLKFQSGKEEDGNTTFFPDTEKPAATA